MTQVSVNDYLKHINDYPKAQSLPQIGKIYVFGYLFNQNKQFDRKKIKENKFYDFYPATFIYEVDRENRLFSGFNLHKIPANARRRWIEILQQFTTKDRLDPEKFVVIKRLFQQSGFSMRQYQMRLTRNVREVPDNKWDEMFNIYANTTFGATSAEISAKYLSLLE